MQQRKSTISTIDAFIGGIVTMFFIAAIVMYMITCYAVEGITNDVSEIKSEIRIMKADQDSIISGLKHYRNEIYGWNNLIQ